MADSVETLGVDLKTRVKKLGAKEKVRRKKCKVRLSIIKKSEAFRKNHMKRHMVYQMQFVEDATTKRTLEFPVGLLVLHSVRDLSSVVDMPWLRACRNAGSPSLSELTAFSSVVSCDSRILESGVVVPCPSAGSWSSFANPRRGFCCSSSFEKRSSFIMAFNSTISTPRSGCASPSCAIS